MNVEAAKHSGNKNDAVTMRSDLNTQINDMPPDVQDALADLVAAAVDSFRDNLVSIVLFGSGAEGRLRPTSDVNLMFVLKRFEQEQANRFRGPLRVAHVAAKVATMFVTEPELTTASELFAVKFGDIAHRHRVLFGELPSVLSTISKAAKKRQLLEMLMNLTMRIRRGYMLHGLREEQLVLSVAGAVAPLRVAAAALLELEGKPAASPKAALEEAVRTLDVNPDMPTRFSEARQTGTLPDGVAEPLLLEIMSLTDALRQRAQALPE